MLSSIRLTMLRNFSNCYLHFVIVPTCYVTTHGECQHIINIIRILTNYENNTVRLLSLIVEGIQMWNRLASEITLLTGLSQLKKHTVCYYFLHFLHMCKYTPVSRLTKNYDCHVSNTCSALTRLCVGCV